MYETRRASDGKLDSAAFLAFVCARVAELPAPHDALETLPRDYRRVRDCVVVLDNYQVHKSALVNAARTRLADAGVVFYALPPYSPHLNRMEPEWHAVKYRDSPVRRHRTGAELKAAVDAALARRASHHCVSHLRESPPRRPLWRHLMGLAPVAILPRPAFLPLCRGRGHLSPPVLGGAAVSKWDY